eukprot:1393505-Pleurochrysis_carterae.AAC.1
MQTDQRPFSAADSIQLPVGRLHHQSHSVKDHAACIHALQLERHVTCLWAASSITAQGDAAQDMSSVDHARAKFDASTLGQFFWPASSRTTLKLTRFEADILRHPCSTLSQTSRAALFNRLILGYRALIGNLISSMAKFKHRRQHCAPILDSVAYLKEAAALESCFLEIVSRPACSNIQPLLQNACALVAMYTEERRNLAHAVLLKLSASPVKSRRTR